MTTQRLRPSILVVMSDKAELDHIAGILEHKELKVTRASNCQEAMSSFYSAPPRCVVLEHNFPGQVLPTFLDEIKVNNIYGYVPSIVILPSAEVARAMDWEQHRADDYLLRPVGEADLLARVNLSMSRLLRDVNANPLTGLPGNIAIMREAERRLLSKEPFALAYFDLDHFKAFNDKYGFQRGDEVIRMTSRLLVNVVIDMGRGEAYVGHVGGDDFILMLPAAMIEDICRAICREFDGISKNFYDEEDRVQGFIATVNRQGEPCTYALMTCSIGVVDTRVTAVNHVADLSTRAAQVKSVAKQMKGSNFVVDKRRT